MKFHEVRNWYSRQQLRLAVHLILAILAAMLWAKPVSVPSNASRHFTLNLSDEVASQRRVLYAGLGTAEKHCQQ